MSVVEYEVALPLLAGWGFDIESERFARTIATIGVGSATAMGLVRFDDFARCTLAYMLEVVEVDGKDKAPPPPSHPRWCCRLRARVVCRLLRASPTRVRLPLDGARSVRRNHSRPTSPRSRQKRSHASRRAAPPGSPPRSPMRPPHSWARERRSMRRPVRTLGGAAPPIGGSHGPQPRRMARPR